MVATMIHIIIAIEANMLVLLVFKITIIIRIMAIRIVMIITI